MWIPASPDARASAADSDRLRTTRPLTLPDSSITAETGKNLCVRSSDLRRRGVPSDSATWTIVSMVWRVAVMKALM